MIEWIRVKHLLPDNAGRYMTCDKHGNIQIRNYYEGQRYPFDISPNHPHFFMPEWWAKLPEVPKEVRK